MSKFDFETFATVHPNGKPFRVFKPEERVIAGVKTLLGVGVHPDGYIVVLFKMMGSHLHYVQHVVSASGAQPTYGLPPYAALALAYELCG